MKKLVYLVFVAFIMFLSLGTAFAHSGGTDSGGGHWNHDTGEYHYHDGEYAGQSSSLSGASSKDSFTPNEYESLGLKDGLQQLCIDTIYSSAYKKEYRSKSLSYCIKHPLFGIVVLFDYRNIFSVTSASINPYSSTRQQWYDSHNLKWISGGHSAYIKGYDYSYEYGNYDKAFITFETSFKAKQAETQGKDKAYTQFYIDLQNYKNLYPSEAFFTTTFLFWGIVGIILLFIIIAFKRKKRKETNSQATNEFEILTDDSTIVCYKRETDTPETTLVSKYSENSLYKLYVVGKDIPQGKTEFSARSKRGGHITIFQNKDGDFVRKYIDFPKSLSIDLKEGKIVEVFNCRWKSIQNDRSDNQ